MLQILIVVVLVVALIVGAYYLFQRRTINKVNDLQALKQRLVGMHVEQKLQSGAQMSLTGESLEEFKQLQTDYEEVKTGHFDQIDRLADQIRNDVKGFNFVKVRNEIKHLEMLVEDTQKIVNHTRESLSDLEKIDIKHREAVSELEQKYQGLRKQLLSENFKFGPSIDQLEDALSKLEDEFAEFSTLTSQGDHVAAQEILTGLKQGTSHLETIIKKIPDLYKNLDVSYPEQLQELQGGYQTLNEENYQFTDANIPAEIANIDKQRTETLTKLSELEIETVEKAQSNIERQIDHLYDVMQKEIDARPEVQELVPEIARFIAHAQNQNHELVVELDRLSQNYTLDHGEIETSRGLSEQIKQVEHSYQEDINAMHKHTGVDSQILVHFQEARETLTSIETQQAEINDGVADLQKDEERAKTTLKRFANEMRSIKRRVESLNLPGIPNDYMDYFFVVSDEIKKLDADISKIKINMEEITKQLLIVQSDLDTLQEKTADLRDSSQLAERLLQYANRLRIDNEEVDEAAEKAQDLFDNQHDYTASLETIATVLDKVEPGSYKKLEDNYYSSLEA